MIEKDSMESRKEEISALIAKGNKKDAIKKLKSIIEDPKISDEEWLEIVEFAFSLSPSLKNK